MIVFRLSKQEWCSDLSGKGAGISGGRWNSRGNNLLYTSPSRALCTAEIAVHIPLGIIPVDYFLVSIEIPENVPVRIVRKEDLPAGWRKFPFDQATQKIGDHFIREKKFLVMEVPSAVVPGDLNYLINPDHPAFNRIKIVSAEPYDFDLRLFRG